MEGIVYQTLGLSNQENVTISKGQAKVLKFQRK